MKEGFKERENECRTRGRRRVSADEGSLRHEQLMLPLETSVYQ